MSWRVDKLLGKEEMLELGCKNFGNMRLRPFWHGCTDVTQPTAASMLDAVQGQSETLQHTQKSGRFSHSFSWTTKQLQSKVGSRKNCVSTLSLCVHPLEVKTSRFCSARTHCNSCLYREIWFVTFNVLYFHIMALGTVGGSLLLTKLQKNIISVHLKSTSDLPHMHYLIKSSRHNSVLHSGFSQSFLIVGLMIGPRGRLILRTPWSRDIARKNWKWIFAGWLTALFFCLAPPLNWR